MRALISGICCLLFASSAFAQGNTRDFGRSGPAAERAAYYAQVRTELNDLLIGWKRAWEIDDAAALAKFYTEDASYYPLHTAPLTTRNSIREYFASWLPRVADVNVQMIGFGTSGDLAYVTARITHFAHTSGGTVAPAMSTELFVFRRLNGRSWQIETQLAQPQPEEKPLP